MRANSLAKLIFVAKNAFDAYFSISAVARSVRKTGTTESCVLMIGSYRLIMTSSEFAVSLPSTIRSGRKKSLSVVPSS